MRALPPMVIAAGLTVGAIALAAPAIVQWQAERLLARFGAEDLVPQLVDQRLADLYLHRMLSGVLACCAVAGGVLMVRGHKLGRALVMVASGGFVIAALESLLWGPALVALPGAILSLAWWSSIGIILVLETRRSSALSPDNTN